MLDRSEQEIEAEISVVERKIKQLEWQLETGAERTSCWLPCEDDDAAVELNLSNERSRLNILRYELNCVRKI